MIYKGKMTLVLFFLFVTLFTTGCSQRMIDFTLISSKSTQFQIPAEAMGPRVEGVDEVWWILSIPLGTPNLKQAVDRAIESAGPGYDALIDGVIYETTAWYLLTAKTGYKIVGTPIKSSLVSESSPQQNSKLTKQLPVYHSSLGISNRGALRRLKIIKSDTPKNSD